MLSLLTVRNGSQHVREVANIALEVRESLNNFVVPHDKDAHVQMRIGIHTSVTFHKFHLALSDVN